MLENVGMNALLNWIELNTPLTRTAFEKLANRDYTGSRLAYAGHIEPKMVSHLEFFARNGAEIMVAPCVPGIAHEASFERLRQSGLITFGTDARTWSDLESAWTAMLGREPNFIFDIGGGLIKKANEMRLTILAASEATSTGIDILKTLTPRFPIFNWNDVPVKNLMHNRYEVGTGIWYAFRKLTGLDLCRMRVGVIGYGLVGQSVASAARGLGAQVFVSERSSIKRLTASSDGFATIDTAGLAGQVDVIISATGVQGTISRDVLIGSKPGLIVANAGHDSRDIDVSDATFKGNVIPDIAQYQVGQSDVFVLAEGRLLNLAVGGGSAVNTFDLVTALIVQVLDYMLMEGASRSPGLHDLPEDVSSGLVAAAAIRADSGH